MGLYSTVMFLIAIGRVSFVFPLSFFSNYMYKSGGESSKISGHQQVGYIHTHVCTFFLINIYSEFTLFFVICFLDGNLVGGSDEGCCLCSLGIQTGILFGHFFDCNV